MQTPWRDWQVSTERIFTRSSPPPRWRPPWARRSRRCLHDDGAGERVANVLERDTPEHAIAETLDDLAALDQRGHLDCVERPAVLLRDDRVLATFDETPA